MNSIHDMGGMHGFGPIPIEENEPVFHHDWEAQAMALRMVMGAWGKWNLDAGRHANERLLPQQYLTLSYYERWITSLADLTVEAGLLSVEEIDAGTPRGKHDLGRDPINAEGVLNLLRKGRPAARPLNEPPRFAIGDNVRAINFNPEGHTRLPRYARGHKGRIILQHGGHLFPDTHAHFQGECPQHLYTVEFAARDLWGPQANERDVVAIDLWESYLEPG